MDAGDDQRGERPAARREFLWALLAALLVGFLGARSVSMERSAGWDESMHAGLPAARIALALEAGAVREAFDVLLDCQQYPPAYPLLLAAAAGTQEGAARRTGRWIWALGLFGLFGATRAAVRRARATDGTPGSAGRDARAALAPWIALALGATSPMWLAYSGTLFLEGPFLTVSILAVWAWLERGRGRTRGARLAREVLAGSLVTLAFFTKFNYGLLLGAGLGLDLAVEWGSAWRRARGRGAQASPAPRELALRTAALAAPFLLVAGWWFLLPFPAGAELAASHRAALLGFLSGNTQLATTPYDRRLWDAAAYLAPTPRMFALWLLGALLALRAPARPGTRVLWFVLLAAYGPVLAHNFHLDRFLLPGAAALWMLAAIGLAQVVPGRGRRARERFLALGAVLALLGQTLDARALAGLLGLRTAANADYVDRLQAERLSLDLARSLPTAGLRRAEFDAFLDAIHRSAGAAASIGWLGINSELSPAALHLGLVARGGSPERLRRDAGRVRADGEPALVVTFQSADPGWTPERLRDWASGFDLVFTTEPLDWKGRRGREFLERYRGWLFETGLWSYERVAEIDVARPVGPPTRVELFACRPSGN